MTAQRWHNKENLPRTLLGKSVVSANSTNSNLINAVAGTYTDIYALLAYNGTASNTVVNLTDGTTAYLFGATANAQTTLYLNNVNSPIAAANANTAWVCNTGLTANISLTALYTLSLS